MTTADQIKETIYTIIENARFAPSVHNTQPWKVRCQDNTITVLPDPNHTLKDGDPTGRQTIISLGIFVQAIQYCAEAQGLAVNAIRFDDTHATLTFHSSDRSPDLDYISLIRRRTTDRSIYRKKTVEQPHISEIEQAGAAIGIGIWTTTDTDFISRAAGLTAQGIGLALSSPTFRKELARYLIMPWSRKKRGISIKSLYIPWVFALIEPVTLKWGLSLKKEANLEKKRWESASAIICITAIGDMPRHWFMVGQSYLRIALKIEELGFSQATSAALVEASTYHEDIAKMLGTNQRLQAVIRIGAGTGNRATSPRVPVENLLTT